MAPPALYWGIDQQLEITPKGMTGIDFATATLRFDLGRDFKQAQFLTVLDGTIARVNDTTLSVAIPGAALTTILGTEKETYLRWQLRARAPGSEVELVDQGQVKVLPAYSDAIAAVETPTTSGTLTGDAATALSALRVITTDGSSDLVYADSSDTTQAAKTFGFTLQAFAEGDAAVAVLASVVIDNGWNWDVELPIFIGAAGVLTQVAPTSGYLRQVATPISATSIYFEPQEATLL